MRGSAKGREPEELRAWKELQLESGIEPDYRALQRPMRDAMLGSLYAEQTGQCVYCRTRDLIGTTQELPSRAFQTPLEISSPAARVR